MNELPRLILAREHVQQGLTPKQIAKRCRSGVIVRVRQGVYVDGATWRALQPWDQYRLRVSAAAETFVAPAVFARHYAASVWGVPTIGWGEPVHALTLQNDGGRSRAGVQRHYADPGTLNVFQRDGLLVTGRVRTVLDLAAFTPFAQAIVPLDHVLRPDAAQGRVGYTDYYWGTARLVGEFDGVEKYLKPEYLRGRTASQAVVDEKERENRIRATGLRVVRWVWADLMEPGRLEQKLAASGAPRRRARSARWP